MGTCNTVTTTTTTATTTSTTSTTTTTTRSTTTSTAAPSVCNIKYSKLCALRVDYQCDNHNPSQILTYDQHLFTSPDDQNIFKDGMFRAPTSGTYAVNFWTSGFAGKKMGRIFLYHNNISISLVVSNSQYYQYNEIVSLEAGDTLHIGIHMKAAHCSLLNSVFCVEPTTTTSTTPTTTISTSTTITTFDRGEILYKANGWSFYKTPVPYGVTLVRGAVATTCEKIGLKAACYAPSGHYLNSQRCVETNVKIGNAYGKGFIIWDLGMILCNLSNPTPSQCPKLNNLFVDLNRKYYGEFGIADGSYWRNGNDYTSTPEKPYYALCVQ